MCIELNICAFWMCQRYLRYFFASSEEFASLWCHIFRATHLRRMFNLASTDDGRRAYAVRIASSRGGTRWPRRRRRQRHISSCRVSESVQQTFVWMWLITTTIYIYIRIGFGSICVPHQQCWFTWFQWIYIVISDAAGLSCGDLIWVFLRCCKKVVNIYIFLLQSFRLSVNIAFVFELPLPLVWWGTLIS